MRRADGGAFICTVCVYNGVKDLQFRFHLYSEISAQFDCDVMRLVVWSTQNGHVHVQQSVYFSIPPHAHVKETLLRVIKIHFTQVYISLS